MNRTVNATSKGLYDFTEDMSFSKLVLRASSLQHGFVPSPTGCPLPDRYVAMQLIQHYLDSVFIQYPFFDETLFMSSVNSVFRAERSASAPDRYIVYMVLAISTLARSQDEDSAASSRAAGYVTAALEHAKGILVPFSSIGIQATLLL